MREIKSLSDLVKAVKVGSPPVPRESPLFDLYLTLRNPNEENEFYEGQGIFRGTKLYFLDNQLFQPTAPCIQDEDLDFEKLMKDNDKLILEIKFTYEYEYPSTQRTELKTLKDYVKIKEGEVYIGGVKPKGREAKEIIKSLNPVF